MVMGFYQDFPLFSFTVYNNFSVEIHKRLHEFEEIHKKLCEFKEIEISGQSRRGDCEKQGGELFRLFFWISSKNSASVLDTC